MSELFFAGSLKSGYDSPRSRPDVQTDNASFESTVTSLLLRDTDTYQDFASLLNNNVRIGSEDDTRHIIEQLTAGAGRLRSALNALREKDSSEDMGHTLTRALSKVASCVNALRKEVVSGNVTGRHSEQGSPVGPQGESPVDAQFASTVPQISSDFDPSQIFASATISSANIRDVPSSSMDVDTAVAHASLQIARQYLEHRAAIASWTAVQVSTQLQLYCTDKTRDLEMRAQIDMERSGLEALSSRCQRKVIDSMRDKICDEAVRAVDVEHAGADYESAEIALQHERGLLKLVDKDVRALQVKLDHLRAAKASCENRITTLTRKVDSARDSFHTARATAQARAVAAVGTLNSAKVERWVAKLCGAFVEDVESEAARLNAKALHCKEQRLTVLMSALANTTLDAIRRSKELATRLGNGRALLAEKLAFSPMTSSTLNGSEPSSTQPLGGDFGNFPPAVQTPEASSNQHKFETDEHRDVVLCAKDILMGMSRIAVNAEELYNRLCEAIDGMEREEIAVADEAREAQRQSAKIYDDITALIDATRGDTLESAYNDAVTGTPRLFRPRSIDDLSEDAKRQISGGSLCSTLGANKRGLPKKLARGRGGMGAASGPTPPPAGSESSRSKDMSIWPGQSGSWLAFLAQFRAAFPLAE
jgi:hypothetical protein